MSVTASGSRPVDRRRRMMALEPEQGPSEVDAMVETPSVPMHRADAAFEGLSRDRLIRRIITPRLWKLVLLGSTITLAPLLLLLIDAFGSMSLPVGRFLNSSLPAAFSGIELLLAAQLSWLIACVRSASAVDYRGGYRSWKRLSWFLGGVAVLILSHSADQSADQLAATVARYVGTLQSARPALLLVPSLAVLAWILRTVIPDMGRCRPAQALLSIGTAIGLVYVVLSIRRQPDAEALSAGIPLMASGVVLSALLLHTRYVIYVNPNPPERRTKQRTALKVAESAGDGIAPKSIEAIAEVAGSSIRDATVHKPSDEEMLVSASGSSVGLSMTGVDGDPSETIADAAVEGAEVETQQDGKSSQKAGKQKGKNRRKAG
ncbi:MAG: hypothetical protein U0996_11510 [Planctomycetaceae bacterium]